MNSELKKSLVDLIDETLGELEELKKSRFSAAEIKIEGPGDGLAGKPTNGSIGKEEDKKEEEDEEAEKAEGKNEEAEKAEGKNEEAAKSDDEDEDDKAEDKKDDKKSMDKAEDKKKEDKKDDKEEMEMKMKKSIDETTSLMKSFVDERIKPLEDKLSTIVDLVHKLADQPVAPKGATSRAMPLSKSTDEFTETLSKAQVSSKLWELKKSGTAVDSLDVTKAEMGQDLESIVKKYKIS